MRGPLALVAAWSIGVSACNGSSRAGPNAASAPGTDSAGVRIVTSQTPQWAGGAGWTVDSVPVLVVDAAHSGPHGGFSSVASAARFPDGRLVVADAATDEVRLFGPEGGFRRMVWAPVSGAGGAPGPERVWALAPDTVVVLFEDDRVRWLSPGGTVLREDSLGAPGTASWDELALLEDGTFVGTLSATAAQLDVSAGGLQRVPTSLLRVDPRTGRTETLASLPGQELFAQTMGGRTMLGIPPLARQTVVRADGPLVLVGTDEGMSYELRRPDGTIVRQVRVDGYDLSGPDTMAQRILDERLRDVEQPAVRQLMRTALGQVPLPDQRPAYADILVAPDGHVWVGKHRGPPIQMPPDAWEVFDPQGRWLGTVRTPEGFRALGVGSDDVLGTANDDTEVEILKIDEGSGG